MVFQQRMPLPRSRPRASWWRRLREPGEAVVDAFTVHAGDRPPGSRAPHPGAVFAVWWLPQYLLLPTRRLGRVPSSGWWVIQPEILWRASDTVSDRYCSHLLLPRVTPPRDLAAAAADITGGPLEFEAAAFQIGCQTPELREEPAWLMWRDQ